MKKIIFSLLAAAALAACTKTDVTYDAPAEIGFAPATKNITKATGTSGNLASTQKLGVWAFWDNDGTTGSVTDYTLFTDNYLVNALFAQKTVGETSVWGGSPTGYPWPVNGALVFAGYTNVLTNDSEVKYVFDDDSMTFTEYDNSNEFDLCWFGRTAQSYNYRTANNSVPVTLSHTLSWITIKVYAEGTPLNSWKITSMTLNDLPYKGTAVCVGTSATWSSTTSKGLRIYESESGTTISASTADDAQELTNNLVIPSTPVTLTVNYTFPVNGVDKEDTKTVQLSLTGDGVKNMWMNGVHYTYTLLFKGNEILVAPSYSDWTTANQTVTVE